METERLRLFVALELSEAARESLIDWRSGTLRGTPELRPVTPESLHVTLCFLGSQRAEVVKEISAACEAAVAGAGSAELAFAAALWLPPRRPRVLAVRLDDISGALARVQGAISAALADGGWYAPEKRPFLPHVTVARVPARARVRSTELPKLPPLTFAAPAVTLYRSRLQRSGARYQTLASVPLNDREREA